MGMYLARLINLPPRSAWQTCLSHHRYVVDVQYDQVKLMQRLALVCARPVSPEMMHRELFSVSETLLWRLQESADLLAASVVGRPRHHGYVGYRRR